jgi:S1-C subfamily serine protease
MVFRLSKSSLITTLISALLGASIVVIGFLLLRRSSGLPHTIKGQRHITSRGALNAEEQTTIELFKNAAASVVYLTSSFREDVGAPSANLFEIPQDAGTGFIWDEQGYIVTNFHLIQNANVARITLSDQSTWEANLVGVEPDKDIAVLKIHVSGTRLSPIPIGTSKDLRVGQRVYAIGNPFGYDHTLTTGVISGLRREIKSVTDRPIQGVIQTDAAINPGNSGGPLLDSAGRLIGMNTAIVSPSGSYAGIGFAVPVDTINRVVPQLIRNGYVRKPGLGIQVAESNYYRSRGVIGALVANVLPASPAEKAGLKPLRMDKNGMIEGDVIIGIDDVPVEDGDDLLNALDDRQPGDTITLRVASVAGERLVKVQLGVLE